MTQATTLSRAESALSIQGLELCKWLGLVAMLWEHCAVYLTLPLPFPQVVGALAFPFFAVGLAAGLAGKPAGKKAQVVRRLFVWGMGAQVASVLVRDLLPLNVLFTLGCGVLLHLAWKDSTGKARAGVVALALAFSVATEFATFGALLVAALLAHLETGKQGVFAPWALAASLPLYAFNEGSFFATVGVLGALLVLQYGPMVSRARRVFYPVYVFQWPLFKLLA
jgi:hypothetical protein